MKRRRHINSLDDDILEHIEMETQDNIDRGMPPEEARHEALRKFGNIALIIEDTRAVWNPIWMEQLLQDLRYGLWMLARSPGFTAVVVVTLCLGIGLNTAVFSVIRAALLRSLPYPDANRLVWLSDHDKSGIGDSPIRRTVFFKWREQARSFEKIGAFADLNAALITGAGGEEEQVTAAGGDFWSITGARPMFGRLFGPEESSVIVLSYDLFEQSFGGNPHVVGQVLSLDGHPVTVTGVLKKGFRLLSPVSGSRVAKRQAYIPIPQGKPTGEVSAEPVEVSATGVVSVVAKLKPHVSIEQAQTEIRSLRSHDPSDQPFLPSMQLRVIPYQERIVGNIRPLLLVLLAAAGLVLLIAVVNIANLLLARATTRQREIGIRVAVGAGRARVARQFLTESLLLALVGGTAGVGLAQAAIVTGVRLGPATIPRLGESRIDGGVLAFTLAISLLTAILFGFGPVLSLWRAKLSDVLKEGARNASVGQGRLRIRALLVAGELAMAIILLTGAGLMLKSFWRMNALPSGFRPEKILTMQVSLSAKQYKAKPAKETFFRELLQRIETAPGVESAGFEAGAITMIGPGNPFKDQVGAVKFTSASAGYVHAAGMSLIKGRWLTNDEPNGVVLVNETFARSVFPGRDPIGRNIRVFRRTTESTIVGVVSDLKRFALDQNAMPEVYMPYKQFPILLNPYIAVRTTGDASIAASSLRKLVAGIDRTAPIYDVMTMEHALASSIAPRRFNLFLLGTFASVALLLALTGIYGVISYSVTQRTQEIGVRMALGAQRNEVIRMVVRQGLGIALSGIGVGLVAAVGLTRFIAGLLYDVKPHDPSVFAAVALTLSATALLASWGPALRAALVDPVIALRYE
ncbi:MAG TPA: ABC transporter permease [Bryobacteraceae bacterium]